MNILDSVISEVNGPIIEDELSYEIYRFSFKFLSNSFSKTSDIPPRIWNGTSFNIMYKDPQSIEDLELWALVDWWGNYNRLEKNLSKDNQLFSITVKFTGYETWCLQWFDHYTFDVGQTDEEAVLSFEKFIQRQERKARIGKLDIGSLMGAEDRWRWKSGDDNYPSIPCRCEYCKKLGVFKIAH